MSTSVTIRRWRTSGNRDEIRLFQLVVRVRLADPAAKVLRTSGSGGSRQDTLIEVDRSALFRSAQRPCRENRHQRQSRQVHAPQKIAHKMESEAVPTAAMVGPKWSEAMPASRLEMLMVSVTRP
jgi:hypothetical protein